MPDSRIYKQPRKFSRSELEAEFATDDGERISNALIAASYTENSEWVEQQCYRFAEHSAPAARGGAAMVLGDISWLHGLKDAVTAVTVLQRLTHDSDPGVKRYAEESLSWALESAAKRKQTQ